MNTRKGSSLRGTCLLLLLVLWVLPAGAQLPLVHVQLHATGQKFRDNIDVAALESEGTKTLVDVLSKNEKFLRFSSSDGAISLHFRLSSRAEEHADVGDPRELGLFISLAGPGVVPGGHAYWVYRKGEDHGAPMGTLADVLHRIEVSAWRSANLQSLTKDLLSHITLGTGGSLVASGQGPLQWHLPAALNDACVVPNDTTFLVFHEGVVNNVEMKPEATVVAVGKEAVAAGNSNTGPPNWIGEASVPVELDNAYRQRLQREIEQISRDPNHMQVRGIFMFLYSPPDQGCDGLFPPHAKNTPGAGGAG
jgi:hypothetical protein